MTLSAILLALVAQNPAPPGPIWSVQAGKGLIWNGEPYRPIGVRTPGDPETIRTLRSEGVNDLLVELPVTGDWKPAFAELNGARFLLGINSAMPMVEGYTVLPQSYRIDGIKSNAPISISLPGAKACFVAMALKRDGSLVWSSRVPVAEGTITFTPKVVTGAEHVALIYPLGPSLKTEDLWEGLDRHRDALLSRLRALPASGLRGIVNPLGVAAKLPARELDVVPTSRMFRVEYADFLATKYRNVLSALQEWSINANDIETFDDLARLIPLWNGSRGVGYLMDPDTGQTYRVDQKRSKVWRDLVTVVSTARDRRLGRMTDAIRRATGVPIVQEWRGWSNATESESYGLDGLGFTAASGGLSQVVDSAARPLSTLLRRAKDGWFVALDLSPIGEPAELPRVIEDLSAAGVTALFLPLDAYRKVGKLPAFPLESAAPQPLYFPENASNPAVAQRIAGNSWWLPAPIDGNRIALAGGFEGYRYTTASGSGFVLWSSTGRRRVRLLTPNAKTITFAATDGTEVNPKTVKGGVEVDVPGGPLVIGGTGVMPIPEGSLGAQQAELGGLIDLANAAKRDVSEDLYPVLDLKTLIEQDPARSSALLDRVLRRLKVRLADYTWIEAESSQNHTFGEIITDFAANSTEALALNAALPADLPHTISFLLPSRVEREQDLWIAAKLSPANRALLSMRVNGQVLRALEEGVGPYGSGYAWYRMGTTRLAAQQNEIAVVIRPRLNDEVVVDAILLADPGVVPNGTRLPLVKTPTPPVKPK